MTASSLRSAPFPARRKKALKVLVSGPAPTSRWRRSYGSERDGSCGGPQRRMPATSRCQRDLTRASFGVYGNGDGNREGSGQVERRPTGSSAARPTGGMRATSRRSHSGPLQSGARGGGNAGTRGGRRSDRAHSSRKGSWHSQQRTHPEPGGEREANWRQPTLSR